MMIRKETKRDFPFVKQLNIEAFKTNDHSDGTEHLLVERLRNSSAYKNELALVYEDSNKILGYILLTEIQIINKTSNHLGLSLAPVAVLPPHQKTGIGSALIKAAHKIAIDLKYNFIVLIGHEDYYPRFGYELADTHNIKFPFDVPRQNCMVKQLKENAINDISGVIQYPKEFYG